MSADFRFRLERLLELRRQTESAAERDWAAAQEAVRRRNDALLAVVREEAESKQEARELKRSSPDPVQLRLLEGYQLALERRRLRETAALQELSRTELERRRRLVEARKGVRVLERFRERQLGLWRARAEAEERRFLDEVAQRTVPGLAEAGGEE
jgi:flagellar export protein FliJ